MTAALKMPSPARARGLIKERLAATASSQKHSLEETMISLGLLNSEQVETVQAARKKCKRAFGRQAVAMGLITSSQLQYALGVQLGFLHETCEPVKIPAALSVVKNPYAPEAKQFHALRTELLTGTTKQQRASIAITGANDKAIAGYTGLNLAAAFAQLGKRVLLVDADFRAPSLRRVFGDEQSTGLADVVLHKVSERTVIRQTLVKNLDILPAGEASDPQAVVVTDRFASVLDWTKDVYDMVMVLTAPYGEETECAYVWSLTGSVFLVARKNYTRAKELAGIQTRLRQSGGELIGAAMTA